MGEISNTIFPAIFVLLIIAGVYSMRIPQESRKLPRQPRRTNGEYAPFNKEVIYYGDLRDSV